MSLSQGPFTPGTATQTTTGGTTYGTPWVNATNAWSNISNLTTGTSGATVAPGTGQSAEVLIVSNYGFSIPTTATIDGIVVQVTGTWSGTRTKQPSPYIVGLSPTIGTNGDTSQPYTTNTTVSYGSSTSLAYWTGSSITPATINGSNFGFGFQPQNPDNSDTFTLSSVEITVYYTPSASVPGAPTTVSVIPLSKSSMFISWFGATNSPTGYALQRQPFGGSYSTIVSNTGSTADGYTDTGLSQNTEYFYEVAGINSSGQGSWSVPTADATTLNVNFAAASFANAAAVQASGGACSTTDNNDVLGSSNPYIAFQFEPNIPAGSVITAAALYLFQAGNGSDLTMDATIYGEASSNSTTLAASSNNISSRTLTSQSISWSETLGTDEYNQSPDLTSIIQAIINLSGWVANNQLCLILESSGATASILMAGGDTNEQAILVVQFKNGITCDSVVASDWAGSLHEDQVVAADTFLTVHGDCNTVSDWCATANGDCTTVADWTLNLTEDAVVAADTFLNVHQDNIVASDFLAMANGDCLTVADWYANLAVDEPIACDWLLNVHEDYTVATDSFLQVNGDCLTIGSFLGMPAGDGVMPVEWANTIEAVYSDSVIPIEINSTVVLDQFIAAEWLGVTLVGSIGLMPASWAGGVGQNSQIASDWTAGVGENVNIDAWWIGPVYRDSIICVDWPNPIIFQDALIAVAWGGSTSSPTADSVIPASWTSTIKEDSPVAVEALLTVNGDCGTVANWTSTIKSDTPMTVDWPQGVIEDQVIAAEWTQGVGQNSSMPADFAGNLNADEIVAAAWGGSTATADYIMAVSWLANLNSDQPTAVDWTSTIINTETIAADTFLTVNGDCDTVAAWAGVVLLDQTIAIDFAGGVGVNSQIPTDILAQINGDHTLPIEYGGGVVLDASIPTDWTANIIDDSSVPIEVFAAMVPCDSVMAADWTATVEETNTIAVDWYGQIPALVDGGVFDLGRREHIFNLPVRGGVYSLPRRGTVWNLK